MSCGDIESNPEHDNRSHNLSICHCNLGGITTNNFINFSLFEAYNIVYDFDFICISETHLNSENLTDYHRLNFPGYAMIRSDHPSNTKRG